MSVGGAVFPTKIVKTTPCTDTGGLFLLEFLEPSGSGKWQVGNAIHFLPDSLATDNPSPWEND
jgi:hypothetical protein